jgi:hypothetical protein
MSRNLFLQKRTPFSLSLPSRATLGDRFGVNTLPGSLSHDPWGDGPYIVRETETYDQNTVLGVMSFGRSEEILVWKQGSPGSRSPASLMTKYAAVEAHEPREGESPWRLPLHQGSRQDEMRTLYHCKTCLHRSKSQSSHMSNAG